MNWDVIRSTVQSAGKFFLTEGEKFVLVRAASLNDQGVFAVVQNLGIEMNALTGK